MLDLLEQIRSDSIRPLSQRTISLICLSVSVQHFVSIELVALQIHRIDHVRSALRHLSCRHQITLRGQLMQLVHFELLYLLAFVLQRLLSYVILAHVDHLRLYLLHVVTRGLQTETLPVVTSINL